MSTSTENLSLIATAKKAAEAGGAVLMDWRGRFSAREKGPADFVTDADVASQEAVKQIVTAEYPQHAFLGEEQADSQSRPTDDQICWICDPLDGTTNYLHDFPCFGVSVGVARGNELLAGVIYDPMRDELFWAGQGAGAWLGETRLATSRGRKLAESLVALSLPANVQSDAPDVKDLISVIGRCQAIRRTGSAALNLAYVACGRLDVHWARRIQPWDVAAGVLLVREAGGHVTNSAGGDFDLWAADFLAAADGPLHAEMRSVLSDPRDRS